ncbi:RNA-processing protein [Candidatus Micrarchaeota archaeon]|nr:RNA-processing protein [Candidatus Micrarchaeota archaeon]
MKRPSSFKEVMRDARAVTDLVLVPKDRIAVVIGKRGETRREIEKLCGIKLSVDSESGEVNITRRLDADPIRALGAQTIIKAIAAGFAPHKAYKLLNENIFVDQIDLKEFGDASERVRARLIGRKGYARKYISKLAGCEIVIGQRFVSFIGEPERVGLAKQCMVKLAEGLPHAPVYKVLERKARELD